MSRKVLAVDDRTSGRDLIRAIFEHAGHLVFEASDEIETMRIAREVGPNLILFDPYMPGFDGFRLLRILGQDPTLRGALIVALTASAMCGDRERMVSAGFDAYISKPVSPKSLRGEVEVLWGCQWPRPTGEQELLLAPYFSPVRM